MKTRFRKNGVYRASDLALRALFAIGRPAADTVIEILKHPNPEFRKMVNYVVRSKHGKQSALEILIEALQDPEPSVRLWALKTLHMPGWGRKLAPASPYIARLADDPAPEVQKLVASLLKKSGVSTKDRSKLLKGLRNPDFVVRKRTALTLAKDAVPPDEAIPVLVEILAAKRTTTTRRPHQTMDGERYLVLQALAKLGPKARPALGAIKAGLPQWLKGRLSGPAQAALDVLEHFVPESEPQFLLALESRRDPLKQKAAGLLARIGMPVIERLLPKAKDRKLRPGIQDKVVQVATAMGARAVKPLMKHLTGPDEINSSIANYALSGIGTPAVPDLVGLLKSQRSSRSVKVALDCLHDMGPKAKPAVRFVKTYASSPVRDVRWAALSVLAVAGGDDPKAVDILLAALADGDPVIRGNVARILGGSTVAPDRAIPAIAKLLDDPDHRTRSWAIFALGDYGKPALP
ncbi:MAG: HEAT repeat domain-containing protein, partial [Planctomycetota bacterium]